MYPKVHRDDDDDDDPETTTEESFSTSFGLMTYLIGGVLLVLWCLSVFVLLKDRQFSLKCAGFGSLVHLTFWKRFLIVCVSGLLLYFQADAVTLLAFVAILYTTVFHDLFFRTDCAALGAAAVVAPPQTVGGAAVAAAAAPKPKSKTPPQTVGGAAVVPQPPAQSWSDWLSTYIPG